MSRFNERRVSIINGDSDSGSIDVVQNQLKRGKGWRVLLAGAIGVGGVAAVAGVGEQDKVFADHICVLFSPDGTCAEYAPHDPEPKDPPTTTKAPTPTTQPSGGGGSGSGGSGGSGSGGGGGIEGPAVVTKSAERIRYEELRDFFGCTEGLGNQALADQVDLAGLVSGWNYAEDLVQDCPAFIVSSDFAEGYVVPALFIADEPTDTDMTPEQRALIAENAEQKYRETLDTDGDGINDAFDQEVTPADQIGDVDENGVATTTTTSTTTTTTLALATTTEAPAEPTVVTSAPEGLEPIVVTVVPATESAAESTDSTPENTEAVNTTNEVFSQETTEQVETAVASGGGGDPELGGGVGVSGEEKLLKNRNTWAVFAGMLGFSGLAVAWSRRGANRSRGKGKKYGHSATKPGHGYGRPVVGN